MGNQRGTIEIRHDEPEPDEPISDQMLSEPYGPVRGGQEEAVETQPETVEMPSRPVRIRYPPARYKDFVPA